VKKSETPSLTTRSLIICCSAESGALGTSVSPVMEAVLDEARPVPLLAAPLDRVDGGSGGGVGSVRTEAGSLLMKDNQAMHQHDEGPTRCTYAGGRRRGPDSSSPSSTPDCRRERGGLANEEVSGKSAREPSTPLRSPTDRSAGRGAGSDASVATCSQAPPSSERVGLPDETASMSMASPAVVRGGAGPAKPGAARVEGG
jgi:hypothetical protein